MKIVNKQRSIQKKQAIAAASTLLFVAIIAYSFASAQQGWWPFASSYESQEATTDGINYSPPTGEEIDNSQDGKKNSAPDYAPISNNDDDVTRRSIAVAVSYADVSGDAVEINAFTPGVVEGTGTCTAVLTKGSATVRQETKAFIDATSSQCSPIMIPLNKFNQSGEWQLVVSYSSPTSYGKSGSIEVTLP